MFFCLSEKLDVEAVNSHLAYKHNVSREIPGLGGKASLGDKSGFPLRNSHNGH